MKHLSPSTLRKSKFRIAPKLYEEPKKAKSKKFKDNVRDIHRSNMLYNKMLNSSARLSMTDGFKSLTQSTHVASQEPSIEVLSNGQHGQPNTRNYRQPKAETTTESGVNFQSPRESITSNRIPIRLPNLNLADLNANKTQLKILTSPPHTRRTNFAKGYIQVTTRQSVTSDPITTQRTTALAAFADGTGTKKER